MTCKNKPKLLAISAPEQRYLLIFSKELTSSTQICCCSAVKSTQNLYGIEPQQTYCFAVKVIHNKPPSSASTGEQNSGTKILSKQCTTKIRFTLLRNRHLKFRNNNSIHCLLHTDAINWTAGNITNNTPKLFIGNHVLWIVDAL